MMMMVERAIHSMTRESTSTSFARRALDAYSSRDDPLSWALDVVASNGVVDLLRDAQRAPRDVSTWAPLGSPRANELADDALVVLGELAAIAQDALEGDGVDVERDEGRNEWTFVDRASGLASARAPTLKCARDSTEKWKYDVLVQTLMLIAPIGVDRQRERCRWSAEVVAHVDAAGERASASVIDMALEDGDEGECVRALVVGAWRGFDGDCEAEKDPRERLGENLDSWREATTVAAALASSSEVVRRVLLCGCAGGAPAAFLSRYVPTVSVDVVEPFETLVDMSVEYFGLECVKCGTGADVGRAGEAGEIRVFSESFVDVARRMTPGAYDAVIGRWPEGDIDEVWNAIRTVTSDTGVVALSSVNGDIARTMIGENKNRARLLRDPADVTFDDIEGRSDKRSRTGDDIPSKVNERDVVCYFMSSPDENVFEANAAWDQRLRAKLGSAASKFPFRLAACDTHGAITVLDYAAVEDVGDAARRPDADDDNAAWDAFGDDDNAPSATVFDSEYWNAILSAHGCAVSSRAASPVDVDASMSAKRVPELAENGYVWGDVIVPSNETTALRRGIEALVEAKWPPACIFVSDVAWRVIDSLFSHAESLLGGECVLEPSVAAFKLEHEASGKRYIGNNFGVPHRDYSLQDAVNEDGSTQILSIWLPLNNVTLTNGCMYVVSKKDDVDGGRSDVAKSAPEIPRGAAKPLAPVEPGTLLAWAGNTIHWGSACSRDSPNAPRISVAFVFRARGAAEARADHRFPPLSRAQARSTTLSERLSIISHAIGVFEHWYGDASDVVRLLKP